MATDFQCEQREEFVYCLNNFIQDWAVFLEVNHWQMGRVCPKLTVTFLFAFLVQQNTNHDANQTPPCLNYMDSFSFDDNKIEKL